MIEPIEPADDLQKSKWIENRAAQSDRPELTSAGVMDQAVEAVPELVEKLWVSNLPKEGPQLRSKHVQTECQCVEPVVPGKLLT